MITLMRKRSPWIKWGLPYALVNLILLWQWHGEMYKPDPEYGILTFIGLFAFIALFFSIRKQFRQLPDEVLDGGTFLRFVFGNVTEDVPLSDIADFEVEQGRRTCVVVTFKAELKNGWQFSFYPPRDSSSLEAIAAVHNRISSRMC